MKTKKWYACSRFGLIVSKEGKCSSNMKELKKHCKQNCKEIIFKHELLEIFKKRKKIITKGCLESLWLEKIMNMINGD